MGGVKRNQVATVKAVALVGFNGAAIEVETDIKAGLPNLQIVGMGNKSIDEARQRVRSALSNSLLDFPAQKITVNLAPAEIPKDGTHLDLPIAISILVASGQLNQSNLKSAVFAGELALTGEIRPIRGAILIAEQAKRQGSERLFLPIQNVAQANLVTGLHVIGISSLKQLYGMLKGLLPIASDSPDAPNASNASESNPPAQDHPTIDEIIGHNQAKRALIISAAGRHNILLSGPPGAGKTLLIKCLPSLLPPLSPQEIIEVTKLHSITRGVDGAIYRTAPLRAPHHNITLTALIGGGLRPRPGDISLAHKGVLFLDELPEYPRASLEALRQPLEDKKVTLARLYGSITYPADILLAATKNPCPCGYLGDALTQCTCSASQINAYQKRISGPLLDRIDLRLTISKIPPEHFFDTNTLQEKQHPKALKLVLKARKAQAVRYNSSNTYNTHASISVAKSTFNISPQAQNLLRTAGSKLNLSNRASLRVLRVARTIADIDGSITLNENHVAEALQYR